MFAKGKDSRASQVRKTLIDLLALTKPWLASGVFNLVLFRDGDFETLGSISYSSLWVPSPFCQHFHFCGINYHLETMSSSSGSA